MALSSVDLDVSRGEFIFLIGPSGAGKTTLLRLMLRQELPTSGTVEVGGRDVVSLRPSRIPELRRSIGVVFQDFKLIRRKTALENVAWVLNVAGIPRSEQKRRAFHALKGVGLHHRLGVLPEALSGGEQQRVAIARAVVNEPDLLLADEPTGNLDHVSGAEVLTALESLNARGITLLVVTHDDEVAARSRRHIRMRDGRIVVDRATAEAAP